MHTAPSVGLAGTWSGQYSGSYSGTLTLTLTQIGARLGGSIKLSAPSVTLTIVGQLKAGMIEFGTVGSMSIDYEGALSGSTISGVYRAGASASGRWSATSTS